MNASNLAFFERFFIIFVKIELCERKTWCYFRNLLYLCHDDLFSFPPKQACQSSLGDFLFLMQRYKNLMTLPIKSLSLFGLICDNPYFRQRCVVAVGKEYDKANWKFQLAERENIALLHYCKIATAIIHVSASLGKR